MHIQIQLKFCEVSDNRPGHIFLIRKVYLSAAIIKNKSGKRGSNPRPLAWEANALPTELLPLVILKLIFLYQIETTRLVMLNFFDV